MENSEKIKVMYFHGKTVDGARYTVSGVVHKNSLKLGMAICSENDQFDKSIGRTISSGRVLTKRGSTKGQSVVSFYNSDIDLEGQYSDKGGFPEKYYVGIEGKIFTGFVQNLNHFTKKELQQNFNLLSR